MMIRAIGFLLLASCLGFSIAADKAYGNRPRGVPAEKASLYEEREEFKCLDGSKSIPYAQVNDDYCDCADGSDEPGTSACNNGHFHCRNNGHRPIDIPSSRVNDMICDCCDGSDEWDSGAQCTNVCRELGAKAREQATVHKELVSKGYAKRVELAKEGAKSMEDKKAELEKMRKELEDLQPIRVGLEASKNEAEQRENEAKNREDGQWNEAVEEKRKQESSSLFAKIDVDNDGKITTEDFIAAVKTATNHEMLDEEIKNIFDDALEMTQELFHSKLRDIRTFFRPPRTTTEPPAASEPNLPEASELDAEEELNDGNLEPEGVEEAHDEEDEYDREKKPEYTEETKRLIEEANKHRDKYRETDDKINDLENQIRNTGAFLQFEYGADYAWAPLKGQCPEVNQAQYTYRLCLFDRAVQKDRNGHHEVGLGNWRGWEGEDDQAKYSIQKYTDGQHCWNGPARSTVVHVECGEELELFDVKEPAKCEYEFRLRAPAACPDPATLKDPFAVHTEL